MYTSLSLSLHIYIYIHMCDVYIHIIIYIYIYTYVRLLYSQRPWSGEGSCPSRPVSPPGLIAAKRAKTAGAERARVCACRVICYAMAYYNQLTMQ